MPASACLPMNYAVRHPWTPGSVPGGIGGGILHLAEQLEADLIVLASHRPEMRDWLIGANAARVVRHARCSVLVVRE